MARMRRRAYWLVAALLLAGSVSSPHAHELQPPANIRAGCFGATDNCRVCKIGVNGDVVGCSFPGIACSPEPWRCNDRANLTNPGPIEAQPAPDPER